MSGEPEEDGRTKGRMHWSWPEGRDFLVWLARCQDGQGTAWGFTTNTRRLHPNNGAASARRVLQALGIPEAMTLDGPDAAVEQFDAGKTEGNRESSVYRLRGDVRDLVSLLLATGHDDWLGSKCAGRLHRAEILERYQFVARTVGARKAALWRAGIQVPLV
jgi:hypothetical protein